MQHNQTISLPLGHP